MKGYAIFLAIVACCCGALADNIDPKIIIRPDPPKTSVPGAITFRLNQSTPMVCSNPGGTDNFICDFKNDSGFMWGSLILKLSPAQDVDLSCSSLFTNSDRRFHNCDDNNPGQHIAIHQFTFDRGIIDPGDTFEIEFDGFSKHRNTKVELTPTFVPEPGTMLLLATGAGIGALRRRRFSVR